MLIATRSLGLRADGKTISFEVRVFAPEKKTTDWSCRVEVGWPDGMTSMEVGGIDSVQALTLALQAVGAQIYTSDHHAKGRLFWMDRGKGYGFPVPNTIKDMLIGDDR